MEGSSCGKNSGELVICARKQEQWGGFWDGGDSAVAGPRPAKGSDGSKVDSYCGPGVVLPRGKPGAVHNLEAGPLQSFLQAL